MSDLEKDTILYVLKKSTEYLQKKNIPNSRLDAEVLLSDVLNLPRIKLYSNFERKLNESEKDNYRQKIKERGLSKPIAYILNHKYFYKSKFYVDSNVLIPRPETEELVDWMLKEMNIEMDTNILDLCSGSGCIGISIKLESKNTNVFFSDISPEAMQVTKKNYSSLLSNSTMNGQFFVGDLFNSIPKEIQFHKIICNPPYIPIQQKESIMLDVLNYEPHIALFLENPDEFYHRLLSSAHFYLVQDGAIYLETDPEWTEKISQIGQNIGYKDAIIKKDLSQKNRFIKLVR